MPHIMKTPAFPVITGYLCLFLALLPGRIDGALLDAASPRCSSCRGSIARAAAGRLTALGLSREEAEERLDVLGKAGIYFSGMLFGAGGEPPRDYDPPINNVALVFLICGIAVGIGLYAGAQTNK
ncbi:MAG: hypothetical protein V1789_07125 [PVC group bacterium]